MCAIAAIAGTHFWNCHCPSELVPSDSLDDFIACRVAESIDCNLEESVQVFDQRPKACEGESWPPDEHIHCEQTTNVRTCSYEIQASKLLSKIMRTKVSCWRPTGALTNVSTRVCVSVNRR